MQTILEKLKDDGTEASFLYPGLPKPIKGRVVRLSNDVVVIEAKTGSSTYEYLCHPGNVCIVQKHEP